MNFFPFVLHFSIYLHLFRYVEQSDDQNFLLCSICGFLYQASKISMKYFKYGVQTKTGLVLPEEFFIKDYAICVKFTDLILGNDFIDTPEFALSTMSNNI